MITEWEIHSSGNFIAFSTYVSDTFPEEIMKRFFNEFYVLNILIA